VVLAPGASKNTKKWTVEGFGKLAKLVKEKYNKDIILIGSSKEKDECETINKLSGNICINLAGELSLKESGALLSKAEFLVTNDSGPFHIGRGVKTKSYVIFGPTDPGMFEYDEFGILIYGNEPCSPCSLHGDKKCPKGHFNCMRNISPEMVMKKIESN
jgi:ADP-heptose:LPS heptosyltransferase